MDYNTAIAAVNAGKYAWRTSWTSPYAWLHLNGSTVYFYTAGTPNGSPYTAPAGDKSATDWAEGDRPPHP